MRAGIDITLKNRQDDLLFANFSRDLARRQRRPRSYPRAPAVLADALEQLCGGGTIAIPPSAAVLPEEVSVIDLDESAE